MSVIKIGYKITSSLKQTWADEYKKQKLIRVITASLIVSYTIGTLLSTQTGYDWYNGFIQFGLDPLNNSYLSWVFMVLAPIARLQYPFAWFTILNSCLLIASIYFVEKPSPWLVLNLPVFWIFFYGQLDGWVIFGTVFGLWAAKQKRPYSLGFALLCLVVKPHIGIPLAIYYFFYLRNIKSLVIPGIVAIISLAIYGFWPLTFVHNYISGGTTLYYFFVKQSVNITLWPWALALLPILFLKWKSITIDSRAVAILAATTLILPYSPFYSISSLIFLASTRQILLFLLIPSWISKSMASISGIIYSLSTFAVYIFSWKLKLQSNHLTSLFSVKREK